jgi:Cysteine-rich CPCC
MWGGPNKDLSLTVARENYKRIGAADPKNLAHVRLPTKEEAGE